MNAATRKLHRHLGIRHTRVHISSRWNRGLPGNRTWEYSCGDHPRRNANQPENWRRWFLAERIPADRVTRIMELLYG